MIFQKNSFIVTFSFWRQLYMFYQPSLDKYNSCLCRTITGIFFWTLKIARTCFCCPISLITMWKRRFWGGGEHIYIHTYVYVRIFFVKNIWPKNKNKLHSSSVRNREAFRSIPSSEDIETKIVHGRSMVRTRRRLFSRGLHREPTIRWEVKPM